MFWARASGHTIRRRPYFEIRIPPSSPPVMEAAMPNVPYATPYWSLLMPMHSKRGRP